MKIIAAIFLLLASCSHSEKNYSVQRWEPSSWMDKEDYVRYVQFFSRSPAAATPSVYKIVGDCGGFPRVDVKTAPGFCLGQIYAGEGLRMPRTAVQVGVNALALVDQGSWNPYDGKIFLLSFSSGNKSELKEILSAKSFSDKKDPRREIVNRPHQISKGPDGKVYVGSATSILRFNPLAQDPVKSIEVLVANIPAEGLHPLKAFVFDGKGSLFVNVGSATNVCQKQGVQGERASTCNEAENTKIGQGQIRRYSVLSNGKISPDFEVYAKGLRNSVALAWDEVHQVLVQGENGRDAIDKFNSKLSGHDFPHDELNLVAKGKHYGWPYCFDENRSNPEWTNIKCSAYAAPHLLLPPHSAPLSFLFYKGDLFPAWYKGRLLATLHGYEAKGHRIVAFQRDAKGFPTGVPQSVVYDWETRGTQKFGSPVGITELADGSLIIVEDKSQKVLRLFFDTAEGDGKAVQELDQAKNGGDPADPEEEEKRHLRLIDKLRDGNAPPFTQFQHKVIDKTCFTCHGGTNAPGVQLLRYDDVGNATRIIDADKAKEILEMMRGNPNYPPMPPQGFDSKEERAEAVRLLEAWIKSMN